MEITRVIIMSISGIGGYIQSVNTPNLDRIFAKGRFGVDTLSASQSKNSNSKEEIYADASPYLPIYQMIEDAFPNLKLAVISAWNHSNEGIVGLHEASVTDHDTIKFAVKYLQEHPEMRLMKIKLNMAAESGRLHGYNSLEHMQAIEQTDDNMGILLRTIETENLQEDSLIIVVSGPEDDVDLDFVYDSSSDGDMIVWGAVGMGIETGVPVGKYVIKSTSDAIIHALGLVNRERMDARLPDALFSTLIKMNGIPKYIEAECSRVLELARPRQGEDTLDFVFITDTHHSIGGNQLFAAQAVRSIAESMHVDFIVHGGDFAANGLKDDVVGAQREILGALTVEGCPLVAVKGNHDDNSIQDFHNAPNRTDNVIYPEEMYEYLVKPLTGKVNGNPNQANGLYYYVDFPSKRARVIALDCIDIPYVSNSDGGLKYPGQWKYAFSHEQINWIAQVALNFEEIDEREHWQVLFVSHVPILQDGVFGADHCIANDEALWQLIVAFQQGSEYRSSMDGEFAYSVTVDFTKQGPVNVAACLFGHVHFDQIVVKNGIPMISTLNAVSYSDFEEAPSRQYYSVTETAFDVVSWDLHNHVMRMTRFGAGQDREIELGRNG
ncbi:metallophosphoesterase [Paenibacillus dokdonensis]|uniref:metallophosphoesterase n=1 Tax=Paenibacillus dokdonensis TaxID=2567944 RepID=UPI0010A7A1A1|nr:metallophosphoesterase [Paenibacillus dokdonensis]